MTTPAPNPGSDTAVASGCKCDVEANRNGLGLPIYDNNERLFYHRDDCPLHGMPPTEAPPAEAAGDSQ